MGWAKYDEDNREITDERRKMQQNTYKYDTSIISFKIPVYVESKETTKKNGGFFIKYPSTTVKF